MIGVVKYFTEFYRFWMAVDPRRFADVQRYYRKSCTCQGCKDGWLKAQGLQELCHCSYYIIRLVPEEALKDAA